MSPDEGFQHIAGRQRAEGRVVTGDTEQREPQLESSQAGKRKEEAPGGDCEGPQGQEWELGLETGLTEGLQADPLPTPPPLPSHHHCHPHLWE